MIPHVDWSELMKRVPPAMHSQECKLIGGDTGQIRMTDLTFIEQEYIFNCPNHEHDSMRMLLGRQNDV